MLLDLLETNKETQILIKESGKLINELKKTVERLQKNAVCNFCGSVKILGTCSNPDCRTTTVCAWCNSVVKQNGNRSSIPIPSEVPLTHTICSTCRLKILKECA